MTDKIVRRHHFLVTVQLMVAPGDGLPEGAALLQNVIHTTDENHLGADGKPILAIKDIALIQRAAYTQIVHKYSLTAPDVRDYIITGLFPLGLMSQEEYQAGLGKPSEATLEEVKEPAKGKPKRKA